MRTIPKRMFPNGLTTVASGTIGANDKREVTRAGKEKLTRGVEKKFAWMEEKSYWDDASKSVQTIKVRIYEEKQTERRRKGKAKFPLPVKERFF